MAAVAKIISPTPHWITQNMDVDAYSQPQGDEGRWLQVRAVEAFRQWNDRAEVFAPTQSAAPDEEFAYKSIPLKPAFYVMTEFKFVGKLKPLPHVADDDA